MKTKKNIGLDQGQVIDAERSEEGFASVIVSDRNGGYVKRRGTRQMTFNSLYTLTVPGLTGSAKCILLLRVQIYFSHQD